MFGHHSHQKLISILAAYDYPHFLLLPLAFVQGLVSLFMFLFDPQVPLQVRGYLLVGTDDADP